jgi:hypothetical protein
LISVTEDNPNKDLIVSMSINQKFRKPKREKRKRDPPPILINSNEGSTKEVKQCYKSFLCFLSLGTPYD